MENYWAENNGLQIIAVPEPIQIQQSFDELPIQQNSGNENLSHHVTYICNVCQRQFSSGQALGGHMRIHSKMKKLEDIVDVTSSSSEKCVDYGTIGTELQSDEVILAAYNLMCLSQGCHDLLDIQKDVNETRRKDENEYGVSEHVIQWKRMRKESQLKNKRVRQVKYNIETTDTVLAEKKMKMIWKPKVRAFKSRSQIQKKIFKGSKVFNCKTCGKIFPTFQALGGHRSSHCKSKNTQAIELSYATEGKKYATSSFQFKGKIECQCNICYKTFPTPKDLVDHKRRHWTGGSTEIELSEVESEDSQTTVGSIEPLPLEEKASKTDHKVLDYDLNDLCTIDE
jgi:DNA-directed RNA polymerase subunit RPC12/RpoP